MTHYTITKKNETWANGTTMISVFNSKSCQEHVGFIRPNGVVEIMVGMKASLKKITLA